MGGVIAADRWEPDESRDSCPVLGGRGGEIPPRYSTTLKAHLISWFQLESLSFLAADRAKVQGTSPRPDFHGQGNPGLHSFLKSLSKPLGNLAGDRPRRADCYRMQGLYTGGTPGHAPLCRKAQGGWHTPST